MFKHVFYINRKQYNNKYIIASLFNDPQPETTTKHTNQEASDLQKSQSV
jgi:hypothetical protein